MIFLVLQLKLRFLDYWKYSSVSSLIEIHFAEWQGS